MAQPATLGFPASFPTPAAFPKVNPVGFPAPAGFPTPAAGFPAFPVARAAPTLPTPAAPAVVTASLTAPPAAATPKAKRPTKAKASLASRYVEARKEYVFLKADGSNGPLHLTGASTHLHKFPQSIYHGLARLFGTMAEITAVLNDAEFQQVLLANQVSLEQVQDPNWIVTAENFSKLRANPNSWVAQELATLKALHVKTPVTLDDFVNQTTHFVDAIKKPKGKTAVKNDPAEAFRNRMAEAQASGKVIDISSFDPVKYGGYKLITKPVPGGRSQRSCLESFPICSTNRESVVAYLQVLGYTGDQLNQLVGEWVQPAARS